MIENSLSLFLPVTSGIPQGSAVGPLFFTLYINDLPEQIPAPIKCHLFADDAKLSRKIRSVRDCIHLQLALIIVWRWSNSWQLSLSISKCIILHLGRANPHFSYRLSDTPLSSQQYVRDLGVTVSTDRSYHKHIESIVSAATKKFYMISRCFHSRDISVLRQIFISFIRPSLEYGSNIWSPWSDSEIEYLEKIQERFTALAYRNTIPPYAQRLRDFNLPSLRARRTALDLVMYYKIITAKTRLDPRDLFTMNIRPSRRSNSLALVMPICHTSAYLHSFVVRSIHAWNSLPDTTVLSRSSSQFFHNVLPRMTN